MKSHNIYFECKSSLSTPTYTILDRFAGCGGMSEGFSTAGLDRDCYAISDAQSWRSAIRPGTFYGFSNIMNADDRYLFLGLNKEINNESKRKVEPRRRI